VAFLAGDNPDIRAIPGRDSNMGKTNELHYWTYEQLREAVANATAMLRSRPRTLTSWVAPLLKNLSNAERPCTEFAKALPKGNRMSTFEVFEASEYPDLKLEPR
jgi:hypothetical protein